MKKGNNTVDTFSSKNSRGSTTMIEHLHLSYAISDQVQFQSFNSLSEKEIEAVFQWRNHSEVRKWMFHKEEIDFNKHLQFLSDLPYQKRKFYWLVKEKNKAIGVVSFSDDKILGMKWGFYLNPSFFGNGYAINLVYHALHFFFKTVQMKELKGFVNCHNLNSILLHHLFDISHVSYESRNSKNRLEWYSLRIISASNWFAQNHSISYLKRRLINDKKSIYNYKKSLLDELNHLKEFGSPPNL